MSHVSFSLSDDEIQRIADAVATRLGARTSDDRWLTVKAASEYSSLSEMALRTAASRGRLPSHRGESGRLMFRESDLNAYLSE